MRIPLALFLGLWLCGWAVGEVFAGRALFWMLPRLGEAEPSQWAGAGFVAFWFTLWTLGGLAASGSLLRTVAGRDEIDIGPDAWRVRRGVWGLGRTRTLPVTAMRAVFLSRRGEVVAELDDRDVVLTRYGTTPEKEAIAARFPPREVPADELPRKWRAVPDGDRLRVELRRFEGAGCLVLCAAVAVAACALIVGIDELPRAAFVGCLLAAALFGALSVWGAFSRRGWLVGAGRVASWVSFPGFRRVTGFDRDSLAVTYRRDSDGDEHFALTGRANGKERTLLREMNDERTVLRLGRFLAARAGWTLRSDDIPRT